MFSTTCTSCSSVLMTQTDQSLNPNFRCKSCSNHKKNQTKEINLDIRFGPKVIYGWPIPLISSYLPSYICQNDVRCDKCHLRFYSNTVPAYCSSCIDTIKSDHICTKCNITTNVTPKLFSKHDSMCIECYNSSIYPFVCSYCAKTFLDSHNSYNALNISVCHACRDTPRYKNILLLNYDNNRNPLIDSILKVRSDIYVNVTYKIEYNRTGSCLYCDDFENSDKFIQKRFPLIQLFDITNIDNLIENDNFHIYYSLPDSILCGSGCNSNQYTIHNIQM